MTITSLIVDDDVSTRGMLSTILRQLGCSRIQTAANGVDAILKCIEMQPDVVWLDIDMPGKDGFETLQSLRMSQPAMFIAMVSGHSTMEYVKRSIELQANGFIAKPFTMAKVQGIIEKFQRETGRSGSHDGAVR